MTVPAVPGVSDVAVNVALLVAWLLVFVVALSQYINGTRSRERLYLAASLTAFWFAFSSVQLADSVSGTAEIGLGVGAFGSIGVGVGAGIQWWRYRSVDADESIAQ